MIFTPKGKHLVAGEWLDGAGTFASAPAHGPAHDFAVGTVELVNRACEAAEEAFWTYGYSSRKERAAFLRAIADLKNSTHHHQQKISSTSPTQQPQKTTKTSQISHLLVLQQYHQQQTQTL